MQEHKKNEVYRKTPRNVLETHYFSQYFNKNRGGDQIFSSKKRILDGKCNIISQNLFNFENSLPKLSSNKTYCIYVHSTKRNTRLSFCNADGSHIFSYTMGSLGHKKSKRGNAYFVKDLCLRFIQKLGQYNISSYVLYISGFGRSRRPIINFFSRSKLRYKCLYIVDVTPKAHNGCRSRIQRRL